MGSAVGNARINYYVTIFAIALIAIILVVVFVITITKTDPGGFIGIIEMVSAAALTGVLFVRNNKRLPTTEERQQLIWRSFAVSFAIVLIPIACLLAYLGFKYGLTDLLQGITEVTPKLPGFLWAGIAAFTLIFTYFSIHLGYGRFTTLFSQGFLKQNES